MRDIANFDIEEALKKANLEEEYDSDLDSSYKYNLKKTLF